MNIILLQNVSKGLAPDCFIIELTLRKTIRWNWSQNENLFAKWIVIQENAFENISCEMSVILRWGYNVLYKWLQVQAMLPFMPS